MRLQQVVTFASVAAKITDRRSPRHKYSQNEKGRTIVRSIKMRHRDMKRGITFGETALIDSFSAGLSPVCNLLKKQTNKKSRVCEAQ